MPKSDYPKPKPRTLKIVEPKKKLKSEKPKPKKKVPKTLRIKEPSKPIPKKKMPKTLKIVGEAVKPAYLNDISKKKYFIILDKTTGKDMDPYSYISKEEEKLLGTVHMYKGFNKENYKEPKDGFFGENDRKYFEQIKRATPLMHQKIDMVNKNLKVLEGKMVLDRSKRATKAFFEFPSPVGKIKIPAKKTQRFKKGQTGAYIEGYKVGMNLDDMFRDLLLNELK